MVKGSSSINHVVLPFKLLIHQQKSLAQQLQYSFNPITNLLYAHRLIALLPETVRFQLQCISVPIVSYTHPSQYYQLVATRHQLAQSGANKKNNNNKYGHKKSVVVNSHDRLTHSMHVRARQVYRAIFLRGICDGSI